MKNINNHKLFNEIARHIVGGADTQLKDVDNTIECGITLTDNGDQLITYNKNINAITLRDNNLDPILTVDEDSSIIYLLLDVIKEMKIEGWDSAT